MTTNCYAMARGRVARFTLLDPCGNPIVSAGTTIVTKGITTVQIDENTTARSHEMLRDERGLGRVLLRGSETTTGYEATIDLVGTDPALISLLTGQPHVTNAHGDVVGNDITTRLPARSFAMEVWSNLTPAINDYSYGQTLFPRLRGGRITGVRFAADSSVSFQIVGARTVRLPKWGTGPHTKVSGWDALGWDTEGWDITADDVDPLVTKNLHWRNRLVRFAPEPTPCWEKGDAGSGFGVGGFGTQPFGL